MLNYIFHLIYSVLKPPRPNTRQNQTITVIPWPPVTGIIISQALKLILALNLKYPELQKHVYTIDTI